MDIKIINFLNDELGLSYSSRTDVLGLKCDYRRLPKLSQGTPIIVTPDSIYLKNPNFNILKYESGKEIGISITHRSEKGLSPKKFIKLKFLVKPIRDKVFLDIIKHFRNITLNGIS